MVTDLVRPNRGGYPPEYVVARVRGRRGRRLAGSSDEEIWRALTAELAWLHGQLDPALARALAPLFALLELKTMVIAIRNTAVDRRTAARTVLAHSLLAGPFRIALRDAPDVAVAVDALVDALTRVAAPFGELATAYADDRLRGFEDALVRIYLEQASAMRLHPAVRAFVAAFIDARNVMLLYKRLRWSLPPDGRFITGGNLSPDLFAQALARGDPAAVSTLAARVTGVRFGLARLPEPALETILLNALTAQIDPLRRGGDPAGVVLAFVWGLYIQARNLSLTHHARDVDRAALDRELAR